MTNDPFRPRSSTTRGRIVGIGAAILALVLALVIVRHFTLRPPETVGSPADTMGVRSRLDAGHAVQMSLADQNRIGVTFSTAAIGWLQREIRTVAQVAYDETRIAAVSLKIDGWVDQLQVEAAGEPVRTGDPLIAVYSPTLVAAQQELLLARKFSADVASGSASTRAGADALYSAARHRLQQWDVPESEIASVERDGMVHRTVTFLSTATGVVIDKNVVRGQRIMAGETLFRIADLSRVWLDGEVFGPDLAAVHVGQEVTAEFSALPGETRQGRISFVYPTLDAETRTAHVRVELANPGLRLKPGMYATIRFTATRSGVLTVPRSSVLTTGERSLVFVRDTDGQFVARDVVVGESTDDRIEILRGLQVGEVVVASGTFLVDAESNLDKALGGMGNMPGMDVKPPLPPAGKPATGAAGAMPGMDMTAPPPAPSATAPRRKP